MSIVPEPKFSVMQCVQLRGRYDKRGELMRGLITDFHYSPVATAWMYDVEWADDATSMFEFDLEPATLLVKEGKA